MGQAVVLRNEGGSSTFSMPQLMMPRRMMLTIEAVAEERHTLRAAANYSVRMSCCHANTGAYSPAARQRVTVTVDTTAEEDADISL
jgi:hypothetical protein